MENETLKEISQHYEMWTKDNEKRTTRKGGWNDVTDAYYGVLPDDWPYITKIVDPRIRTSLIEKNGRLLNSKLRGRLVPREGGDMLKAQINNAVLDFQWDTANHGGSMMTKLSISDVDARLYGSKFALVYWRYEEDDEGNVLFDGNEMKPLDIRDVGLDPSASHVKDAKWAQVRTWEFLEDLEQKTTTGGDPQFKNLAEVRRKLEEKLPNQSQRRRTERRSRIKEIRGLEDRLGEDMAFPVVELVTEYREDKWITFVPDMDLIVREIDNPYDHGQIPIAQLRYYALQDDPIGESEVEPVIPLWKAIQATVCSYMDEVILKMRPPLKIVEGAVRIETIQYGPEAQWLVDSPDAITEMAGSGENIQHFQTSYSALVSAFNIAMGDLSQGVSSFDPFEKEAKTATEIRATQRQQNVRDQKNQNDLAEFIKDIMLMWLRNNQQFLFTDPDKSEYVVRILGQEMMSKFKRAGMDETEVTNENAQMVADIVSQNPDLSDGDIAELMEAAETPRFPVVENPDEKDPEKLRIKPKLRPTETGDSAELSVTPNDVEGHYDYIPDVKSMALGAGEEMKAARQRAVELFTTNPTVLQLMQQEGFRPNVKELLRSMLEELGLKDAERFFTKIEDAEQQQQLTQGAPQGAAQNPQGSPANSQFGGLQGAPQANTGQGGQQQMARPDRV